MDQAVGGGPARRDRHLECLDGQAGLEMVVDGPSDDAATEGIEDDRIDGPSSTPASSWPKNSRRISSAAKIAIV